MPSFATSSEIENKNLLRTGIAKQRKKSVKYQNLLNVIGKIHLIISSVAQESLIPITVSTPVKINE